MTPEERAAKHIKDAEMTKARILPSNDKQFLHNFSAVTDENYIVVGGHVDLNGKNQVRRLCGFWKTNSKRLDPGRGGSKVGNCHQRGSDILCSSLRNHSYHFLY